MQVINDVISFIKTLSFVDITFFFAVLSLMLLIITLIYFIRENSLIDEQTLDTENKDTLISKEEKELKKDSIDELLEIASAIEQAEPNNNINMYEEEQEEKAIISYDELVKHKNDFAINYSEEEELDNDLTVKKVDLNNLLNKNIIEHQKINVSVISYDKEEAFLEALKKLQQTLN